MSVRKQITLLLIATKQYKQFVQPLLEGVKKYFLINHDITVELFVDELGTYNGDERVKVNQTLIVSYGFPQATLKRYEIMTGKTYSCDYLYYLDIDSAIVDTIDEEIFGNIVAIEHPGFSVLGGGSWCTDEKSNAYTFPENRVKYFCGGTQGGKYEYYYRAMQRMKREINDDEKRGVKAEHNDEGHWNKYLSELKSFKVLDSRYCMVQQPHLQHAWGISHLSAKILALEKNHDEIRK
tara:strand:+ start:6848 stop:7558 length:711 start_codon:yes stop_codon:yes gene_type:complete